MCTSEKRCCKINVTIVLEWLDSSSSWNFRTVKKWLNCALLSVAIMVLFCMKTISQTFWTSLSEKGRTRRKQILTIDFLVWYFYMLHRVARSFIVHENVLRRMPCCYKGIIINLEEFIILCMWMLSLHTDCTNSIFTQYMQKTEEFQQHSQGLQPKQQGQM